MGLTKRWLMERYPQSDEEYIPPETNHFRCQASNCNMVWSIGLTDCCEADTETRKAVICPYCKCDKLSIEKL
jgi:hypothetical protein